MVPLAGISAFSVSVASIKGGARINMGNGSEIGRLGPAKRLAMPSRANRRPENISPAFLDLRSTVSIVYSIVHLVK